MHSKTNLCGGCGWNTGPANCFVFDLLLASPELYDRFVRTDEIRNQDIGIGSLPFLTHHFVGAWKFAGDSSILVLQTLCFH